MPGQFTGKRGEAQTWIGAFINEGMTNAEIVSTLQGVGLGYRQMNMYSDINRVRLEQFAGQGLRGFDEDTPIPRNLMREWQGDTQYKYRVVVQYEYTPSGAEQTAKGATTMYYNQPPTINDVMEDWQVRVKTIEGGFVGYEHVGQIENVTEINYFYNTPKE